MAKGLVINEKPLCSKRGGQMKRYLKDFNISLEFVRDRVYLCLNTDRWHRADTSYFLAGYMKEVIERKGKRVNLHFLAKRIRSLTYTEIWRLFPLVDYISIQIYKEIKSHNVQLPPIEYQIRKDGSNGKEREIGIASIKQQVYDYIAVGACEDMFLKKIGTYQCASLKNKGQIYGKTAIEKWIRRNPKECKWIYKCDIKKYYPSVDHNLIMAKLERDIKNDTVIYLLRKLIGSYKTGLCIGSYLCQYLANYYLSYLYHYLDGFQSISHKLFYMDDIIIFSPNKRKLKNVIEKMRKFLKEELGLNIKHNELLFKLDSRPIDMMGYKIYTYKTTVRERIYKRATKLFRSIKSPYISLKKAYKCISYYGYIVHSDSEMYKRRNKIYKKLKLAKEKISYEAKNGSNSRIAKLLIHCIA